MRIPHEGIMMIFNQENGEWTCRFLYSKQQPCVIPLALQRKITLEHNKIHLTLCYAPVSMEASRNIVRQATELGISAIQNVITQNTVKRDYAHKFESWVKEAAEQSNRLDLPIIKQKYHSKKLYQHTKRNFHHMQ